MSDKYVVYLYLFSRIILRFMSKNGSRLKRLKYSIQFYVTCDSNRTNISDLSILLVCSQLFWGLMYVTIKSCNI